MSSEQGEYDMPTFLKLLLACLVCLGVAIGLTLLIERF